MSVAVLPSQGEIEALYASSVGDQYLSRHRAPDPKRASFWRSVVAEATPRRVLEVGCGAGGNLAQIAVPERFGVDIHAPSLAHTKRTTGAKVYRASATALPFPDRSMDLVFTAGMLIHVHEDVLPTVLKELGRVSARYVLMVEYVDSHRRAIPWRGHDGILFADRFPLEYWRHNPHYSPVWRKPVLKSQGFDKCEAALFARREDS